MRLEFICFYCEQRQRWIIAEEGPNDPRIEIAETASEFYAWMVCDALNEQRAAAIR